MQPAGEIRREHLVGVLGFQLDCEEAVCVGRHRKLIELPELKFIHPGAHNFTLHGFVFRRREAMAAEDVRVHSNTLTQAFVQLTSTR